MKTIKFSLILLAFMAFAQTTWAQSNSTALPCLPSHGEDDDQSAWCGEIQTLALSAGWNWVSLYVEGDPVDMLDMLKASLGTNALQIQYLDQYMTEFDGEDWFGDLDEVGLDNDKTYLVEMSAACTAEVQGVPANVEDYTIEINPGWNWIGFPSAVALNVNDALANFEAEEGDQISSIVLGTSEYDGEEWFGDLEDFEPGYGYMYLSNSDGTKYMIFHAESNGRKAETPAGKLSLAKTAPVTRVIGIDGSKAKTSNRKRIEVKVKQLKYQEK